MKSMHIIYGEEVSARTAHAHHLARSRPEALVYEIGRPIDLSLMAGGDYEYGIGILKARSEAQARETMARYVGGSDLQPWR